MKRCTWPAATALAALLLTLSSCTIVFPQRLDNLGAAECSTQATQAVETMLAAYGEAPPVAHTLAVSAVEKMQGDAANAPRQGSRLAADLRVLTSKASVGAPSGAVYDVTAERPNGGGCQLRISSFSKAHEATQAVPACTCEPAQD
jgi:hypothetical protein